MKYKITRTSSYRDDSQPCEGCVRESYIETQEIEQRDDIKKPGGTWFTHGFNHREEDGKWKRDHSYEGWFLEVPDLVALLVREEYYAENDEQREELKGKSTLIIAKQRNGPVGDIPLKFLKEYTRFEDRAEEVE